MRVFCLKPDEIETCWEDFAVILQRFEHQCQNLMADQICAAVKASTGFLWGVQDETRVHGVLFAEVQRTAKGLVCVLVGAYGSVPEPDKRALLAEVEIWAKTLGCVALKIVGRKGWLRWDRRFRPTGIVMEAPL